MPVLFSFGVIEFFVSIAYNNDDIQDTCMEREHFAIIPQESEKEAQERATREKEEYSASVESGADWLLRMLENHPAYSERIPLRRDHSFDVPANVTELPLHLSQLVRQAKQMEYSQQGLYDLAREIRKKHPELQFSFQVDPQGKWIEYSVEKQNLNIGDEVLWESQGLTHWDEPKKITSIHNDPQSKRAYAFVEGGTTGIPLDELVLSGKES